MNGMDIKKSEKKKNEFEGKKTQRANIIHENVLSVCVCVTGFESKKEEIRRLNEWNVCLCNWSASVPSRFFSVYFVH